MAFSDNFDGTLNQPLELRTGWVRMFGDTNLRASSAGRLARVLVTNGVALFLRTEDSGTLVQEVSVDINGGTSSSHYVMVMASGTEVANRSGYAIYVSGTTLRLRKITNGVVSNDLRSVSISGVAQVGVRATVAGDGSSVSLQLTQGGVDLGAPWVDTSGTRFTTGRPGILVGSTTALGGIFDNWSDNGVAPVLGINPLPHNFIEGVANAGAVAVPFAGVCPANATVEARILDAADNVVIDWTALAGSTAGGTYSSRLTGAIPVGLGYKRQVRNAASPGDVVDDFKPFTVGAIFLWWGQSQQGIFVTSGSTAVTPSAAALERCFLLTDPLKTAAAGQSNPVVPTIYPANSLEVGSALRAAFNQYCEDDATNTPLLAVDLAAYGSSIGNWLDDTGRGSPAYVVPLLAGATVSVAAAVHNRWTGEVWMQGTADVGHHETYPANMEALASAFDALVESGAALPIARLVNPHPRSDDGGNTWLMRNAQYERASVPGTHRWQVGAWLLDHGLVIGEVGSPHQQTDALDANRMGRRVGRRIAAALGNPVDPYGPRVVRADFVDDTRMAIDVLFDRDIRTPAGVTTALPGHNLSQANGSPPAVPLSGDYTAAIVGPRTVRLTTTGAAFPLGLCRYDLLRGVPFANDPSSPDYVGHNETTMEANFLSKVITDTTAFDDNRGNLAVPVMGTGIPVALPIAVTASDATGSAVLRVRQA